jgi:DNA-binding winged helix-turn-helix (wHTH) protein/tetratricopeptide (TPR) repeat protein
MNDRFSADDLPRKGGSTARPSPWPIDLAHTRAFQLGLTEVRPATREIVNGKQREVLEPLVMQVLVALAAARGEIVSRDDLIDACWGGRVVTDDAINRVISRLRALSRTFDGFQVETVTKVGYRLVASGSAALAPDAPANPARRHYILGGSAIAGLGVVGLAGWRFLSRQTPSEQAEVLIQKGMASLQGNDVLESQDTGSALEAIALLTEATRIAPDSASAWGALALAYASRFGASALPERPGVESRGRAAAKRALELDPAEERALGALRVFDPVYRNWARVERADRSVLPRNPKLPILLFVMSDMLGSVGRWKEALSFSRRYDRNRFVIPGADRKLLVDLWASGDLQAADAMLEAAVRTWPQHPQIWSTRFHYLMYSGRAREVLAILDDGGDRPLGLKPEYFEAVRTTAEALAGRREPTEAVRRNLDYLKVWPAAALQVAQACVALGAGETAFDLLNGYYFGEGRWKGIAPIGGDQDRLTSPLFQPVMKSVWRTNEFARLVMRIGLEDYWRKTGTSPDYRRGT